MADKVDEIVTSSYCDEDSLTVNMTSFDLIISGGTLDSVNDLPGALLQIRRSLRPDGLFLGTLFGAGTLHRLKQAMMLADGESVTPHIHPQIELRAAADLLTRAGFNLQVADRATVDVRYADWRTLITDLRDGGIGNSLAGKRSFLGRDYPMRLDRVWQTLGEKDGKVSERFEFIHLSGWSPSPAQPKPAARGSGKMSLSTLLDKSGKF
ncbi:MAG: methyltransferase domain-containing protein [Sphingorhabdus sp.]